MTSKTKETIISVGFDISLPDDINDIIMKQLNPENREHYMIPSKVMCGVMYDKLCKGGLGDVHADQSTMEMWYNGKKDKTYYASIKKVFMLSKPPLIVTEIQLGSEAVYAFLSNTRQVSTTQFKKGIVNKTFDVKMIILSEPIKVEIKVYKHLTQKIVQRRLTR